MDFRLIDYSSAYFKAALPPARRGKFLQIVEDGETELLILSPYELSKYHAQILERYCALGKLGGRFLRKPEHYLADECGIEVTGGGHWKIDDAARRLVLGGESTIYGRFDAEGLPEKIGGLPEYGGYAVTID